MTLLRTIQRDPTTWRAACCYWLAIGGMALLDLRGWW